MGGHGEKCSVVEVAGESIRVMGGADDWTNQDFEAFAEVVRAAKRKFQAEVTPPADPEDGAR